MWSMLTRKLATTTIDDDINLELERWPQEFLYSNLVTATKNFKKDRLLGQGGFGGVYRGFLDDLGRDVAIKRLSASSGQGSKEYLTEVRVMSRLRHRNVLQLFGYCQENDQPLLVYELAPNGSLYSQLFESTGPTMLSWARRRKIVRGLAYALRYLQEECTQSVVHRDIKPGNVLLDKNFEVKLGDFGISMLADDRTELDEDVYNLGYSVSDEISTHVCGTFGYVDPEYITTARVSKESDLYGFGIVVLQIACGKNVIFDDTHLRNWIWELYKNGKLMEAVDQRLGTNFDHEEMEKLMMLGLWCANSSRKKRPSIRQIIGVLDYDAPLPKLEIPHDLHRGSSETTAESPQTHTLPSVIALASSSTSLPFCTNSNSQPSCAVANSKKIFIDLQGRHTDKTFASSIIKDMTGERVCSKTYTYSRETKTNTKTFCGKM